MFFDALMASCSPLWTETRAPTCVTGGSPPPSSAGTVAVGPVATDVASALSGSTWLMFARRNVTWAGEGSGSVPIWPPNARMRNLVITPSTGAPPEYGSPLGLLGTVNDTIEHEASIAGSLQGS